MLEALDQIIAAIVPSLTQMGQALSVYVNMPVSMGGTMPLSTAALDGFLLPGVNNLGGVLVAVATFLNSL